jgi:hypothetical protein
MMKNKSINYQIPKPHQMPLKWWRQWQAKQTIRNDVTAIYEDCVELTDSVWEVEFMHCPREANEAADEISRLCSSYQNSCNWVDEPLAFC